MKVHNVLSNINLIIKHINVYDHYYKKVIEFRDNIIVFQKNENKDSLRAVINEWESYQWYVIQHIHYNRIHKHIDVSERSIYIHILKGQGGLDVEELQKSFINLYYKFILNIDNKAWISDDKIFMSDFKLFCTLYYSENNIIYKIIRVSPYCNKRQTSFIKVICCIESMENFELNYKHLLIEATKSSGAGGQHVNKTNSAIRIVHIPTGISVFISEERSQSLNKKLALIRLAEKVNIAQTEEKNKKKSIQYKHSAKIAFGNKYDRIINLHQNKYIDIKSLNIKLSIDNIDKINLCKIILLFFYSSLN